MKSFILRVLLQLFFASFLFISLASAAELACDKLKILS